MPKYVKVSITQNKPVLAQSDLGAIMILGTSKNVPYAKFNTSILLEELAKTESFGVNSKEYALARKIVSRRPAVSEVAVFGVQYDETADAQALVTALQTLIQTNSDWHYLMTTSHTDDVVDALGEFVSRESVDKFYVGSSDNKEINETSKHENAFVLIHDKPETFPGETLGATVLAKATGTYGWTFKTLDGIDVSNYSQAEIDSLYNRGLATYARQNGFNISTHGKTLSGDWADVIQSIQYIKRAQVAAIMQVFVTNDKVPYTQAGLDLIEGTIANTFESAPAGMIATGEGGVLVYEVNMPTLASISGGDFLERVLKGITWSARIAGAIQEVDVQGEFTFA